MRIKNEELENQVEILNHKLRELGTNDTFSISCAYGGYALENTKHDLMSNGHCYTKKELYEAMNLINNVLNCI